MKIRHVLIIVSSIILMIIIYYIGYYSYKMGIDYGVQNAEDIRKEKEIKAEKDTIGPKYVKTALINNQTRPLTISSFGRVTSSSNINISSEVQGKLSSNISLKKGTEFTKGQLIVKIDDKDAQLAIKARKSNYLNIISLSMPDFIVDFPDEYKKWSAFFNSIQVEKTLPSIPGFVNSKEKNFIISRNILSEYYNIKSDEERLKKYNITAPFEGTIIEAYTDEGAIVNPGAPIIKIIRKGKLEIEIPIPVQNKSFVKIGNKVQLTENNEKFEGSISRIGEFVNSNTQNLSVYVTINNEIGKLLYDGMYMDAIIICEGVENVAEIPRRAIFNKNSIYTVNKNLRLIPTQLDIVVTKENSFIVKGLSDSTIIVIEPVINAKDSMEVSIQLDETITNP